MSGDNSTVGGPANNATFQTAGGGSPSGLVLDLSEVEQVNQTGAEESTKTTAYRERMVPGSDEGLLQSFSPINAQRYAAHVLDSNAQELLQTIAVESRRQTLILLHLFNVTTDQSLELEDVDSLIDDET